MGERTAGERSYPGEAAAGKAFARFYSIVARLRDGDGCPWDKEQTPGSLRGSVVEEAYELVEAIDENDSVHVAEEAGDLFLLVTMIPYILEQRGEPGVAEVLDGISAKLVRRHPHVFGEAVAETSDAVLRQWDEIKEKVEGRRRKDSLLDSVSRALPPLERAYKLQKKAAKAGFDWTRAADVWAKAREELDEAEAACEARAAGKRAAGDAEAALEAELGDLLFSAVNVSRFLGVDPALALHAANEKFSRRFRHVERRMAESGRALSAAAMAEMDAFWDEAKAAEKPPKD